MKTYTLVCTGYSLEGADDILIVKVDETGKHILKNSYRQGKNPSFCVRCGEYLYTVEETDDSAAICAWKVKGEELEATDMRIEVPGTALCHLCPTEQGLIGSSYLTGDYFAVDYELKEVLWHRKPVPYRNPDNSRQECPHAHWAAFWEEELVLADLGSDRIWRYQMKDGLPTKELVPLCLELGAGPRQPMELDENRLFTVQELDSTLCLWKKEGENIRCVDKVRTTASENDNFPGTMCFAEENTVLICNRGANTISAVKVCSDKLQLVGEWETAVWPRHIMRIGDTNLFMNSCNESGKLVLFVWEKENLVKKGEIDLPGASCAALL